MRRDEILRRQGDEGEKLLYLRREREGILSHHATHAAASPSLALALAGLTILTGPSHPTTAAHSIPTSSLLLLLLLLLHHHHHLSLLMKHHCVIVRQIGTDRQHPVAATVNRSRACAYSRKFIPNSTTPGMLPYVFAHFCARVRQLSARVGSKLKVSKEERSPTLESG